MVDGLTVDAPAGRAELAPLQDDEAVELTNVPVELDDEGDESTVEDATGG